MKNRSVLTILAAIFILPAMVMALETVDLGVIEADSGFEFNLAEALGPSCSSTTYQKSSGPAWLELSEEGVIKAAPTKADIGEFNAKVLVDCCCGGKDVELQGEVQ